MSWCYEGMDVDKGGQSFEPFKQSRSCEQRAGEEGKAAQGPVLRSDKEFGCSRINREATPTATAHLW